MYGTVTRDVRRAGCLSQKGCGWQDECVGLGGGRSRVRRKGSSQRTPSLKGKLLALVRRNASRIETQCSSSLGNKALGLRNVRRTLDYPLLRCNITTKLRRFSVPADLPSMKELTVKPLTQEPKSQQRLARLRGVKLGILESLSQAISISHSCCF